MMNVNEKKMKLFPTEIKHRIISFLRMEWMFDTEKKRDFFQIGCELLMYVNEMSHILLYTDMRDEVMYYLTKKIRVKQIQQILTDYATVRNYMIYHRLFVRCFRMSLYFVKRLQNGNLTSETLVELQKRVHDVLKNAN